jgi:hypothetical protein
LICLIPNLQHTKRHYLFYWHHTNAHTLPVQLAPHTCTHTGHLLSFSEKLVNNIPGLCTLIQNLYQVDWKASSSQPVRYSDYRLDDNSLDNITTDSGTLLIKKVYSYTAPPLLELHGMFYGAFLLLNFPFNPTPLVDYSGNKMSWHTKMACHY